MLCLSSFQYHSPCFVQDSERQGISFIDRTQLANSGMVSNLSSATCGTAHTFATLEQSVCFAPQQTPSPSLKQVTPNHLDCVRGSLTNRGVFQQAVNILSLCVPAGHLGQKNSTEQFGKSGLAGVIRGTSIPFRHLLRTWLIFWPNVWRNRQKLLIVHWTLINQLCLQPYALVAIPLLYLIHWYADYLPWISIYDHDRMFR